MIRARQEGITPEELIAASHKRHSQDFSDFQVVFDNYSSTNTEYNKELCCGIYNSLEKGGHVHTSEIDQYYCDTCNMFLPDRFIKGTCPKCNSPEQYGDSCDNCGSVYSPADVKDAYCATCGSKPVLKKSSHVFVKLADFQDFLEEWIPKHTPAGEAKKLLDWFKEGLRDWDISRDDPYFGFEIPGHPGKYFYVWVDAPIGYIASTQEWCERNGKDIRAFWNDENTEIYHNIGKDIFRFHALFWPTMLKADGFKTPNEIFVHGFLTVNGEKMSKSKGTFIKARTYLNHLDPTYLRFYYACKLDNSTDDIDLNLEDFAQRVNSDLVGKITNLASRGAQMLQKKIDGKLGELDEDGKALLATAQEKGDIIAEHFEKRYFSKALTEIRALADEANRYFDTKEPWKTIKTDPESTRQVLTSVLNVFRVLAIYLKPVLPEYTASVEELFNEKPYNWDSSKETLTNQPINDYKYLAQRVDQKNIDKMVEDTKADLKAEQELVTVKKNTYLPEVTIDDFSKIDLRAALIIEAEDVKGASKLLRIKVDMGNGETRQILAGIKSAYDPEKLIGKTVVVVANLKPRKMNFGVSEGMIIAAGPGEKDIFVLSPDSGATAGMEVH
jgi:methionyl-tRNA synthetase